MRRILLVVSLLFLSPLCARAQETPNVELFGGYSYFRTENGGNLHGWNGSVAVNLNKWFGVVVDVGGHYDSDSSRLEFIPNLPDFPTFPGIPPITFRSERDRKIHTVMAGPRFSYRKMEKLTPFAHALFGVSRTHTEDLFQSSSISSFSSSTDTTFAMAIGGGLDVKLSKRLALRAIQADYLYQRFGFDRLGLFNTPHHNFRAGVGIVFRFGGQ